MAEIIETIEFEWDKLPKPINKRAHEILYDKILPPNKKAYGLNLYDDNSVTINTGEASGFVPLVKHQIKLNWFYHWVKPYCKIVDTLEKT